MLYEKWNGKKYWINYYTMENFGSFLFKFEINIRKNIRLIESTDKKLTNAEFALLFNETCKYVYTYIYIYAYIEDMWLHVAMWQRDCV